jgi:hypothetical protein
MQTDLTLYLADVVSLSIERVPHKGLVRIKIKGEKGGWADEMSITLWGNQLTRTMPEITDTTSDEPPPEALLKAVEAEDADL